MRPITSRLNIYENWSGRRGSNPRPRPWQGRALPLSYTRIRKKRWRRRPRRAGNGRRMANAGGECNACEGFKTTQNSLISQPNPINEPELALFRVRIRPFGESRGRTPVPDRTGLAVLDPAPASIADRVVVEIANDFPDLERRLPKDRAAMAPSPRRLEPRRDNTDGAHAKNPPISDQRGGRGTRLKFALRLPSRA